MATQVFGTRHGGLNLKNPRAPAGRVNLRFGRDIAIERAMLVLQRMLVFTKHGSRSHAPTYTPPSPCLSWRPEPRWHMIIILTEFTQAEFNSKFHFNLDL